MLALQETEDSHIVLVEEPENHLSFSNLNKIMEKIDRQVRRQAGVRHYAQLVRTQQTGARQSDPAHTCRGMRITDLSPDTVDYFMKLPGFDTLRLVLAKRVILVEGPSDELVVQRAYRDTRRQASHPRRRRRHEHGGLSAKRFLDIAVSLEKPVAVVNDNDSDEATVRDRYGDYTEYGFIRICIGKGEPGTLEPQILAANGRDDSSTRCWEEATTRMTSCWPTWRANKTTCALAIFESATRSPCRSTSLTPSPNNRAIIAAAGSRKTQYVIDEALAATARPAYTHHHLHPRELRPDHPPAPPGQRLRAAQC